MQNLTLIVFFPSKVEAVQCYKSNPDFFRVFRSPDKKFRWKNRKFQIPEAKNTAKIARNLVEMSDFRQKSAISPKFDYWKTYLW